MQIFMRQMKQVRKTYSKDKKRCVGTGSESCVLDSVAQLISWPKMQTVDFVGAISQVNILLTLPSNSQRISLRKTRSVFVILSGACFVKK